MCDIRLQEISDSWKYPTPTSFFINFTTPIVVHALFWHGNFVKYRYFTFYSLNIYQFLCMFVWLFIILNGKCDIYHVLAYCPHISQSCCLNSLTQMATATTRQSRLSLDTISVALKDDSMEHIQFLQRLNLLASDMTCSCGVQMSLGQKSDLTDGHNFRCSSCKTTKSVRHGRFFTKGKLRLSKWIIVIYCWVRQYPVTKACEESRASHKATIDIF